MPEKADQRVPAGQSASCSEPNTNALIGSTYDSADTMDSVSILEVTAGNLYDGDVAVVALVQEDKSAFDTAFDGYQTIIRHCAVDVLDEVDPTRRATAKFDEGKRITNAQFASATREMLGTE